MLTLFRKHPAQAVWALRADLNEQRQATRLGACDGLGEIGGKEDLAVLDKMVDEHPDERTRSAAKDAACKVSERLKPGG